jgi:hypothetical protein
VVLVVSEVVVVVEDDVGTDSVVDVEETAVEDGCVSVVEVVVVEDAVVAVVVTVVFLAAETGIPALHRQISAAAVPAVRRMMVRLFIECSFIHMKGDSAGTESPFLFLKIVTAWVTQPGRNLPA